MECLAVDLGVEPLVEAPVAVADLARDWLGSEELARGVLRCVVAAALARVELDFRAACLDDVGLVGKSAQVLALNKVVVWTV